MRNDGRAERQPCDRLADDPEDPMALSSTARRTAIAVGASAVLLALGGLTPVAADPPEPPMPDISRLPDPGHDWWAVCITYTPPVTHPPQVCVPDLTK